MNVLIAEDDRVSALILRKTIERMGHKPTVAVDGQGAWEAFQAGEFHLVISDWMMPGIDGLELCRNIRSSGVDYYVYFVLLTAKAQREDRLHALESGVDDFLPKPLNQADLAARMNTASRILTWEHQLREVNETLMQNTMLLAAQAAELERMRREAEFLATHDVLTGVLNRRAWFQLATTTKPQGVALFDIDHFKSVNDRYGHPAGDEVLATVAARLAEALGPQASLGRVGGEEFGALLYHEPFAQAVAVCELAITNAASTEIELPGGPSIKVSLSAGLSPWLSGRLSREESLASTYESADRLLYQAKRAGRARLVASLREAA